jgi:gluconokinase
MGVSGCGKSTLGRALAEQLDWCFVEGDSLHPSRNIEKMTAGLPLDDEDREPFLERVAETIAAARNRGIVVSCSALKRGYRDLIRARAGEVTFVLPLATRDVLASRLSQRADHFMPTSLLDSQLAALEQPELDEHAILVDGSLPTAAQVAQVLAVLVSQHCASSP